MKIIFVCTGNACRSALAEVVLRELLASENVNGVEVASCGTKCYGALERDAVMCRVAAERGYVLGGTAVHMSEKMLSEADLIVVMTEHHRNEVTRVLPYPLWKRIVRFNEVCLGEGTDVADPSFQTEHVYRQCFERIEGGCREIVKKLKARGADAVGQEPV